VNAESTGNAGSDFSIARWNDAGGWIDNPLLITRSTGLATVIGDPTANLGIATKQYVDTKASSESTVTPAASWQDYGGNYAGLWLTRVGKHVTVEGLLKRITATLAVTANTFYTVGSVPVGWRPAHNWTCPALYSLTGTGFVMGELEFSASTGDILWSPSASGTMGIGGWITLAGSYRGV
jgi:hypothetical protein